MIASAPEATVVIPTRNRPDDLARCLESVRAQATDREYEVIVVDDGSAPPVSVPEGVRVVRRGGAGISAARNAGIEAAAGAVIAFADDDVEADPGWLDSVLGFLERHPDRVGVEGPVTTPPFDPLRAKSVDVRGPGTYRACNVAYRRATLEALGGFSAEIPRQGEDLDLGFRALELGPIGWEPRMRVSHRPRSLSLREIVGRAGDAPMEVLLLRRHRSRLGGAAWIPAYLFPYVNIVSVWTGVGRAELPGILLRPGRLARLAAIMVGQAAVATRALVRFALARGRRDPYRAPAGPPR